MKKLLQICLIVILVFVLFQAVVGSAATASGQLDSVAASPNSSTMSVSVEDAHASACLVRVRGVVCVKPLVGWNS
jgi:hypothetical protein